MGMEGRVYGWRDFGVFEYGRHCAVYGVGELRMSFEEVEKMYAEMEFISVQKKGKVEGVGGFRFRPPTGISLERAEGCYMALVYGLGKGIKRLAMDVVRRVGFVPDLRFGDLTVGFLENQFHDRVAEYDQMTDLAERLGLDFEVMYGVISYKSFLQEAKGMDELESFRMALDKYGADRVGFERFLRGQ